MSEREFWQKEAPKDPATDTYARELEQAPQVEVKTSDDMSEKQKADLVLLHTALQVTGMAVAKQQSKARQDDRDSDLLDEDRYDDEEDDADDSPDARGLGFDEVSPKVAAIKKQYFYPSIFVAVCFVAAFVFGLLWFLKIVGF